MCVHLSTLTDSLNDVNSHVNVIKRSMIIVLAIQVINTCILTSWSFSQCLSIVCLAAICWPDMCYGFALNVAAWRPDLVGLETYVYVLVWLSLKAKVDDFINDVNAHVNVASVYVCKCMFL